MIKRRYSQLRKLETFEERFNYLKLYGEVGAAIFGEERWLNQLLYQSLEWRRVRNRVIRRDRGLDLGIPGYEIADKAVVHHMNPVSIQDLEEFNPDVLNPEYLITVSAGTHRAIHYGDANQVPRLPTDRQPGDTRLW